MRGPDVAVVEDVWGPPLDHLATRYRVERHPTAWAEPAQLTRLLRTARAIVVRNRTHVGPELLAAAPRLRLIARAGVGLDNIDLAAAHARGVVVVSPKGANSTSVAEHALALALALARHLVPVDGAVRRGSWERRPGRELSGGTWSILGLGATGQAVARLARAFGMDVLAHDPYVPPGAGGPAPIPLVALHEAVARADVLSIHLPSTPETRGLVGAALLSLMQPHALLISLGRGDVLDEDALATALTAGRLAGAGLDVRCHEPPEPGVIETLDNVVLTPHVAGITSQSQQRILAALASDIDRVLSGQPAEHAVSLEMVPPARREDAH